MRDPKITMDTVRLAGAVMTTTRDPMDLGPLFALLAAEPLDRSFEAYGNFIMPDPRNGRGEALLTPGGVSFWGNFARWSFVFNIDTDEPILIAALTAAIRLNQRRADYLARNRGDEHHV